jgi:trans-aconitate methyltransferase
MLAPIYEARLEASTADFRPHVEVLRRHVPGGGRVLEVGSGAGASTLLLTRSGLRPCAVEASSRMAQSIRRHNPDAQVVNADILTLRPKPIFDAVTAYAFIHLWPRKDVGAVIRRLCGFLRPGGVVQLSTTIASTYSEGWEAKADYMKPNVRRFRAHWPEAELAELLATLGLYTISRHYIPTEHKHWVLFTAKPA